VAAGTTTLYLYDGFNCIAEYTGTTLTTRTWGLDLSGSLQGAGGVGGLLAVNIGGTSYYPAFDGNGNVSEYLTTSGDVAAHFEYDPFGNLTYLSEQTAGLSALFDYRFSTKPLDQFTGLYYYLYRWYDPLTGRWPSRDPIGERGGLNLYVFVENSPGMAWDILGNKPNDDDPIMCHCRLIVDCKCCETKDSYEACAENIIVFSLRSGDNEKDARESAITFVREEATRQCERATCPKRGVGCAATIKGEPNCDCGKNSELMLGDWENGGNLNNPPVNPPRLGVPEWNWS
jgi:RHS repeat-associated protein